MIDCARCLLPNKYKILLNSLPNYREYITNNVDKILPKFCNMFFIKRFTLIMDPILIVLLKIIYAKFDIKKWRGQVPQK